MSRVFFKQLLLAASLSAALVSAPARAQSEASLVLSALPVASVVGAGAAVAGSAVAGAAAVSAVPAALAVSGAVLVVKAVEVSARGTVIVLERASDGARVSLELSGRAASGVVAGVGAAVAVNVVVSDVDAVAVTYGPGLVGALLIGVSAAKALAYAAGKPLVPVNHIEGHVSANYVAHPDLEPPFVCLVASGGHSHIVRVEDYGVYTLLGQTMDDAAGEAFDKAARVLGLPYPGGPLLDKLSREGNPHALKLPHVQTPGRYDYSFSGLKNLPPEHVHSERAPAVLHFGQQKDVTSGPLASDQKIPVTN